MVVRYRNRIGTSQSPTKCNFGRVAWRPQLPTGVMNGRCTLAGYAMVMLDWKHAFRARCSVRRSAAKLAKRRATSCFGARTLARSAGRPGVGVRPAWGRAKLCVASHGMGVADPREAR